MSDDPKDLLIEKAVSAFRERDAWGRILPSPSWLDLPAEDRDALFARQLESRLIERARSQRTEHHSPGFSQATEVAVLIDVLFAGVGHRYSEW